MFGLWFTGAEHGNGLSSYSVSRVSGLPSSVLNAVHWHMHRCTIVEKSGCLKQPGHVKHNPLVARRLHDFVSCSKLLSLDAH